MVRLLFIRKSDNLLGNTLVYPKVSGLNR